MVRLHDVRIARYSMRVWGSPKNRRGCIASLHPLDDGRQINPNRKNGPAAPTSSCLNRPAAQRRVNARPTTSHFCRRRNNANLACMSDPSAPKTSSKGRACTAVGCRDTAARRCDHRCGHRAGDGMHGRYGGRWRTDCPEDRESASFRKAPRQSHIPLSTPPAGRGRRMLTSIRSPVLSS